MRSPSSFSVGEITRAAAKRSAISSAIRKHSAQTMSLSVLSARSCFPSHQILPAVALHVAFSYLQACSALVWSCLFTFVMLYALNLFPSLWQVLPLFFFPFQHLKHLKCWPQKCSHFPVSICSFDSSDIHRVMWNLSFKVHQACAVPCQCAGYRKSKIFSLFKLLWGNIKVNWQYEYEPSYAICLS